MTSISDNFSPSGESFPMSPSVKISPLLASSIDYVPYSIPTSPTEWKYHILEQNEEFRKHCRGFVTPCDSVSLNGGKRSMISSACTVVPLPSLWLVQQHYREMHSSSSLPPSPSPPSPGSPSFSFLPSSDTICDSPMVWTIPSLSDYINIYNLATGALNYRLDQPKPGVLPSTLAHGPLRMILRYRSSPKNRLPPWDLSYSSVQSMGISSLIHPSEYIHVDFVWIGFHDGTIRVVSPSHLLSLGTTWGERRSKSASPFRSPDGLFELPKHHNAPIVSIRFSPMRDNENPAEYWHSSPIDSTLVGKGKEIKNKRQKNDTRHLLESQVSALTRHGDLPTDHYYDFCCVASEDSTITIWRLLEVYHSIHIVLSQSFFSPGSPLSSSLNSKSPNEEPWKGRSESLFTPSTFRSYLSPNNATYRPYSVPCAIITCPVFLTLKGSITPFRLLRWVTTEVTTDGYFAERKAITVTRDAEDVETADDHGRLQLYQTETAEEIREGRKQALNISEEEMQYLDKVYEKYLPPVLQEPLTRKQAHWLIAGDTSGSVYLWNFVEVVRYGWGRRYQSWAGKSFSPTIIPSISFPFPLPPSTLHSPGEAENWIMLPKPPSIDVMRIRLMGVNTRITGLAVFVPPRISVSLRRRQVDAASKSSISLLEPSAAVKYQIREEENTFEPLTDNAVIWFVLQNMKIFIACDGVLYCIQATHPKERSQDANLNLHPVFSVTGDHKGMEGEENPIKESSSLLWWYSRHNPFSTISSYNGTVVFNQTQFESQKSSITLLEVHFSNRTLFVARRNGPCRIYAIYPGGIAAIGLLSSPSTQQPLRLINSIADVVEAETTEGISKRESTSKSLCSMSLTVRSQDHHIPKKAEDLITWEEEWTQWKSEKKVITWFHHWMPLTRHYGWRVYSLTVSNPRNSSLSPTDVTFHNMEMILSMRTTLFPSVSRFMEAQENHLMRLLKITICSVHHFCAIKRFRRKKIQLQKRSNLLSSLIEENGNMIWILHRYWRAWRYRTLWQTIHALQSKKVRLEAISIKRHQRCARALYDIRITSKETRACAQNRAVRYLHGRVIFCWRWFRWVIWQRWMGIKKSASKGKESLGNACFKIDINHSLPIMREGGNIEFSVMPPIFQNAKWKNFVEVSISIYQMRLTLLRHESFFTKYKYYEISTNLVHQQLGKWQRLSLSCENIIPLGNTPQVAQSMLKDLIVFMNSIRRNRIFLHNRISSFNPMVMEIRYIVQGKKLTMEHVSFMLLESLLPRLRELASQVSKDSEIVATEKDFISPWKQNLLLSSIMVCLDFLSVAMRQSTDIESGVLELIGKRDFSQIIASFQACTKLRMVG